MKPKNNQKFFTTIFLTVLFSFFIFPQEFLYAKTSFTASNLAIKWPLLFNRLAPKNSTKGGICGPQGCGPDRTIERETIKLQLSAKQVAMLMNTYCKIGGISLSEVIITFNDDKYFISANSKYLFIKGRASGTGRIKYNGFYLDEIYLGKRKQSERIRNFVVANANGIFSKLLSRYNVFLYHMELEDSMLFFEASAPKGMIKEENGVIKLNLASRPD